MDDRSRENRFADDVDRMLAGGDVGPTETRGDEGYRSNMEFAHKIIECRGKPSLSFTQALRGRLLAKLAEQEVATERRRNEKMSVRGRLLGMFPRSPAWRVAALTVMVAVLALVAVWRLGLLAPTKGPVLTSPGPVAPRVAVQVSAVADKAAYALGENVGIRFEFRNVTSEPLSMPFPPLLRIVNANEEIVRSFTAGQDAKTFAAGESLTYDLSWNQRDDAGNQVPPGDYQVRMPMVRLAGGAVAGLEPLALTIRP